MQMFDVLIVGAGHAGAHTAISLRQLGFAGSIGMIGDEPELPYERPPLSKDFLSGDKTFERMLIRPPSFWIDRDVTMLIGEQVVKVDPVACTASTADGKTLGYGHLVWAGGGAARKLSCDGHDLAGIHAIRTRADVDALKAELGDAKRIAVVGGGYIGLEAAAVLSKLGKQVIVLEAMDRVLARVTGPALSHFFEAEHRAHDVDIRTGAIVLAVSGANGKASGVVLAGGERIAADIVVVGIGIVPNVAPLSAAGASGSNGVDVDEYCRTSLPKIFAIGDCAAHANPFSDGSPMVRLESVQNANDMATTVARLMTGNPKPYHAVPWFWSNQYDLRLQTVGLSAGHDATVLRGDPTARAFSIIYLRSGRIVALDCVNSARDYVQGKALIEAGCCVDPLALTDATIPLKSHLRPSM